MRILAFDTATRATAAALCDFEGEGTGSNGWSSLHELEVRDDPPTSQRPRHASRLMVSVVELIERTRSSWEEIDRIAVGVGPGTFTGLRIGVASARGLSRARGIPLVGISTLESLAHGLLRNRSPRKGEDRCDAVLAVLDARRGEAFAAAWRVGRSTNENGASLAQPLLAPCALAPKQLAESVAGLSPGLVAVGDGAVKFRTVLERTGALIPEDDSALHRVSAVNHCRLAVDLCPGVAEEVHPAYLRLPDAELARRAAEHS